MNVVVHGGKAHLDDPEVSFAHAGGFVAKTKSRNLGEAWRLTEAAYGKEAPRE